MRLKFEETNLSAIRDRRSDYPILTQNELAKTLSSKISQWKKIKLLNTQIGYLRINIFHEYYEQIGNLQKKNELDKAADLMSKYAEIAIPFVPTKEQSRITRWLRKLLHLKKLFEPASTIQNWRISYASWLAQEESSQPTKSNLERAEQFAKVFTAFITLYTYSFSVSNFPPLGQRRTDR